MFVFWVLAYRFGNISMEIICLVILASFIFVSDSMSTIILCISLRLVSNACLVRNPPLNFKRINSNVGNTLIYECIAAGITAGILFTDPHHTLSSTDSHVPVLLPHLILLYSFPQKIFYLARVNIHVHFSFSLHLHFICLFYLEFSFTEGSFTHSGVVLGRLQYKALETIW